MAKQRSTEKTKPAVRLCVRLIRSAIGTNPVQRATLHSMGLRKINQQRELPDNPQVRGMIFRVQHLVNVLPVPVQES